MDNILNIKSASEFRSWLEIHKDIEKECFVALKRGKPQDDSNFYYLDAIEVALCFGWIDSTLTSIDGISYQRFSKRNKNSYWSELNKERVNRLYNLGLMSKEEYDKVPHDKVKFDKEIIKLLKKNKAYDNFMNFPELYQRIRMYNLIFARDVIKINYEKTLSHFIEETRKNKMYGMWNDYGRLI